MRNTERRKYRFAKILRDLMAMNPITGKVTRCDTLAKILHVSERKVKDYRSGKSVPDLATAFEIATYFGVTLDYLVIGFDDFNAEYITMNVNSQRKFKASEQIAALCSQAQELAIRLMESEIDRRDKEIGFNEEEIV